MEGNNALDWAADTGDVNVLEYLIRKSLDPTRLNSSGSSALHLAVKSGKVDAARFLVKCGCDPMQRNGDKESPMMIAINMRNRDLVRALREGRKVGRRCRRVFLCKSRGEENHAPPLIEGPLVGIPGGRVQGIRSTDCGDRKARLNSLLGSSITSNITVEEGRLEPQSYHGGLGISLYVENRHGDRRPHALCRLQQSRFSFALMYAFIILGYWVLTLCIPFYAWLFLSLMSFFAFR